MAEVAKGIIDIEINTGRAASQLQALQTQINAFNLALNKSNKAQGTFAAEYSRELQSAINKTGLFTAETIRLQTAAATLDKTLSKGKTSLGQFFSAKFNKDSAIAAETMALASERARRLQTQFIATAGAANGFQDALAVRPLAAFSSEAAVAAQRTQILSNMFKQGTTQLINFGKNVQWAGRQLMVGFTVPLTIFGSIAGKTFMDLEKQAVAFKKVYGDIFTTPAELNQNLEAVKGLAAEYTKYGIAVKDTIGLAAQAAAAGRQNADLTDAVSQATRLATLGQMDQNAALETTISLQSAFRLSGKDLADTINFLNMVENQTVVSLQDIAAAIPRVAPVIQGLGGDVKDLTVFLAAMQEGGVDAAEGANALKSGLASLINPTKQANEMLSGMGINLQSIIESNKGDLMGTVRSFAEALQGLDQFSRQQALEQVFGKFQYAKLGALFENISREGSQAQQVIATMGYSTEQLGATADKELKTIEESFGVQLTGAVERFKLAIAPIGELFVRLAIPLVNFATTIAEGFNGLSDGQKRFAAIAAVIVGVVIPAVTMMSGLFLNLVGTLAKIGQGMALFGKGFITGGPVGAVKALTQSSKYLSLAEMDAAMAAQQLSSSSKILNTTLVEQAITGNAAAAAINNLTKAYSAMIATQGAAGSLPSFGTAAAAGAAAKGGKTNAVTVRGLRRNSGGGVPGVGNTDTVPAMLTPGEFVINKEATKQNLGLLKEINDGSVKGYNKGGKVPGVQYFGTNEEQRVVQSVRELKNIAGGFSELGGSTISQAPSRAGSGAFNLGNAPQSLIQELIESLTTAGAPSDIIQELGSFISPTPRRGSYDFNNNLRAGSVSRREMVSLFNMSQFTHGSGPKVSPFQFLYDEIGDVPESIDKEIRKSAIRISASYPKGHTFTDPDYGNIFVKAIEEASIDDKTRSQLLQAAVANQEVGARRAGSFMPFAEQAGLKRAFKKNGDPYQRATFIFTGSDGSSIKLAAGETRDIKGKRSYQKIKSIPGYNKAHVISQVIKALAIRRNSGGPIPGSGNTDTVPAMLTPGEFVVNKKAASQNQGILEMMNGGKVKGYRLGGIVGGAGGLAAMGGMMTGNMPLMIAGAVVQTLVPMLGKVAGKGGVDGAPSGISGGIKNVIPSLKNISIAGRTLSLGMVSMAGGVALAGLAIYKLNESLNDAQKSGAKLSDAMYGSAEKTKAMGEAFGRESRADASRRLAVERAGGQKITEEAQAASSEFMKTDAASQMIKDLELVKKSGEDVALSLRNQLASSIVAGVINPEEAKAIAIDMGKALKDESLSIKVAGQLNSLLGPEGEKLLTDPAGIIIAITPQINKDKLKNDAQDAYDQLNPLQAFGQLFKGGKQEFVKNFSIETISSQNASALAKEAEARAMLNAQVQEGTITLEQYIKAVKSLGEASASGQKAVADANAQALGFADVAAMNSAANRMSDRQKQIDTNTGANGQTLTAEQRNQLLNEGSQDIAGQQALESANKIKEQLREILKTSGYEDAAAQSIITGVENGLADGRVGDAASLFAKVISQELRTEDINMVARLKLEGDLDQAGVDDLIAKIDILRTDPEVETKFNFNSVNTGEDINEILSLYDQLQKNPDITKKMFAEDKFSSVFKQFGINYNKIAALPDLTQAIVTKNIETYVKYEASIVRDRRTDPSEVARDLRILDATLGQNIRNTFGPKTGVDKPQDFSGMEPAGGGGGKGKENDLLKMLMERFRLQEMLIDKEAEGFNNRVKQLNREIELEERQVSLRQKGLDQLSKKEQAVNDAYNLRVEALDKVSESNSRISEQESSRISLASALASGDIAAAATISSEMQQQSAQYQIEDARAALEKQRQTDLDALTVSINGKLMTRKGIEFEIEQIQDRIYNKGIEIQGIQDTLIGFENRKLEIAKEREKVEIRMFLMAQKQAILDLTKESKKNKGKGLTAEQNQELAEYKNSYNAFAKLIGMEQLKKYGGSIARMANGGVAYKGSTEAPPAIRMNDGFTVPGNGMTDKVSALLTPGEFVVRKSVADKNRGFLQALNGQVFPGVGGKQGIPKNNFLDGIGSPRFSIPESGVANVPVANTNVVSTSSPMYNSTYNVNVNVSGTNASPDDIANVVMAKLSNQNRGNLRSNRY